MAGVIVQVRTLAGPKHSGQFGGAAPDALLALIRALATLHDEHGDVAVAGLRREEWTGASYSEEEFRELAEVRPECRSSGTGGLGERIWSGPALTVTGIDAQPVDRRSTPWCRYARAKISVRGSIPSRIQLEAQAALVSHLEGTAAVRDRARGRGGRDRQGLRAKTSGPAYEAASDRARDRLGR